MTIKKTTAGASTPPKAIEIPKAYLDLATTMLDGMSPNIEEAIDDAISYHRSAGKQMTSNDFGFRVSIPASDVSTESKADRQQLADALKVQLRSKGYDNPTAEPGANEDGRYIDIGFKVGGII